MVCAAAVRFCERERYALEDVADTPQRGDAPVAPGVELLAVDQIHDDVEIAIVEVRPTLEAVHSNDVRVVELQQDSTFAADTCLVAVALLGIEVRGFVQRQ